MHILITGASGFLGQFLAKALLADPSNTVTLTDVIDVPVPTGAKNPQNVKTVKADLSTESSKVITEDLDAAYIFHGIMSAGAEANFDLGMKVNVDATRSVLEAIRHTKPGLRVIYASSQAVYGQPLPEIVTEAVVPTPEGSYGAEKLICETLVNDYTRRGWISGFSLRFPTVTVRPGKPSMAASSFISGIVREPLAGKECVVPIADRSFPSWVCSPRTLIRNLVHVLTLPDDALPPHKRTVNAPGIAATVQDMLDALSKVGGEDKLKLVKEESEPEMERILRSWAANFDNSLAFSLGFKNDEGGFEGCVREYVSWLKEEGEEGGRGQ